jgi:nitrate reductase molybdenum cofactor assembly chaperone NarJ/NarW
MSVMAPTVSREALASLAPLFHWPDEKHPGTIEAARAAAALCDRHVGKILANFAAEFGALTPAEREITYTSTFDLAPSCSPYVGVHIFGDDGPDRARLMVGLRTTFAAADHDCHGELPDHLAVVLSFATRFDEEEWMDLVRLVLVPAAERMDGLLSKTSNPYRHAISATRRLCRAAFEEGGWV